MPAGRAPETAVQHLQVAEDLSGVQRSDGPSGTGPEQAERAVDGSGQEGAFRGEHRQHLKGELESVRAMIAEMQALRTAVQRGDVVYCNVPPSPLAASYCPAP